MMTPDKLAAFWRSYGDKLRWYNDAGHGWLAVPIRALLDSGVAGQISDCSYIDGSMAIAYLEEDCDAPAFLAAVGVSFETSAVAFPEEYLEDGQCFIRQLYRFVAAEVVGPAHDVLA